MSRTAPTIADWAGRAVAAPAEDVRSRVAASRVLAEALAAAGEPTAARVAADEAVRLAYATQQASERAGADAVRERLGGPAPGVAALLPGVAAAPPGDAPPAVAGVPAAS